MYFSRRSLFKALLSAGILAVAPGVRGQGPVKIIVPTPPGGTLDFMARIVAEHLSKELSKPVVVENRTGASSSIGTRYVKDSAHDGQTLLIVGNTFASTPAVMSGAGYDPVKDFVGVSELAHIPVMLVVSADSPYKTVVELIAAAKEKPSDITYASAGYGSTANFASERWAHELGLKLTHVPFRGNGEAIINVSSGLISMMFDQVSSSLPHVRAGRLRALAIASNQRSNLLPDVPTFAESGVGKFEEYTWLGLVVPAKTPEEILKNLNTAAVKVLKMEDVKSRFSEQGLEILGTSSEEFTTLIHSEAERLAKLAEIAATPK